MEISSRVRSFFYALFHRKQIEHEMHDELQFHLETYADSLVNQGFSREEALRQARLKFGSLDKFKEVVREARGLRLVDELRGDIHYALRQFGHNPVFTIVAIFVLALGIGANTAILSFIDAIVFRPLPAFEPDRLMTSPQSWSVTDCEDVRQDGQIFSGLASYLGLRLEVRDSNYDLLSGRGVSANFFEVLGMKMAMGRGFLPGEDSFSSIHPVVVISHRYWQRVFQGDPAAIGRSIELNREQLTIVGVAPKNFRGMMSTGPYQDIWVPLPVFLKIMHIPMDQLRVGEHIRSIESRDLRGLSIIGRLEEGVSREQAAARMKVLSQSLQKAYPETNSGWNPALISANKARDPGQSKFSFGILGAAGLCVLLITCTNVASLLLARGTARRREIGLRSALGASRSRVIRQLLTESIVLSAAAVLVSLVVCRLMLKILPMLESTVGTYLGEALGVPLILNVPVDSRVLAFAVGIGLVTTFLFGLAPAFIASRSDLNSITKNADSLGLDRLRSKWRRSLVVAQIALSVILLIAAGLFARTILHFKNANAGYAQDALILTSDFLSLGRSPEIEFYTNSLERVKQLPGVRSASWAEYPPLEHGLMADQVRRETDSGDRAWLRVDTNSVTPDYFRTVGIPIVQGRDFTNRDHRSGSGVMIVNETLARRYWPGESPLGKRIQVRDLHTGEGGARCEVIGVVKDVKYRALEESSVPYVYYALGQTGPNFNMQLHVNAVGDSKSLIVPIRRACETVNPLVGISNARLVSEQLDRFLFQERAAAQILGIFGPFSLLLAAVGLYGVISYSVARRSAEFGIRMALGAQQFDITRLVVLEGIGSALVGLAIGIPASIALSRVIEHRLHGGVSPLDPITYGLVTVICLIVALMAAVLPARKAHHYPFSFLRSE